MKKCQFPKPLKLFIATPITGHIGRQSEITRLRCLVDTIDSFAQERGVVTWCAFREEGWTGEQDPSIYVPRDFNWTKECTGAIMIPQDSYGVRIELGWLIAFTKPVMRLHDTGISFKSGLDKNISNIGSVSDRIFTTISQLGDFVNEFIDFLEQK